MIKNAYKAITKSVCFHGDIVTLKDGYCRHFSMMELSDKDIKVEEIFAVIDTGCNRIAVFGDKVLLAGWDTEFVFDEQLSTEKIYGSEKSPAELICEYRKPI